MALELVQELNRLAGTTDLTETLAANVWAGTEGLEFCQAVNVACSTTTTCEVVVALNFAAGTVGLPEPLAASLL